MINLKLKLLERNRTQRWLAKETSIPESYISMAIRGRYTLSRIQIERIVEVLGCKISQIEEVTCQI